MCSATPHLGGKITKSAQATPGSTVGHVNTVKIEGSYVIFISLSMCIEDDLPHDRMTLYS